MLTSSPKIGNVNRETFSNSIALAVINKFEKGEVEKISTVFGLVFHVVCWRVLRNWAF